MNFRTNLLNNEHFVALWILI